MEIQGGRKAGLLMPEISPWQTLLVALAVLACVVCARLKIGPGISLAPFYLAPVLMITRRSGLWPGLAMAVIVAFVSTLANLHGLPNSSDWWMLLWNTLMGTLLMGVFAFLGAKSLRNK